MYTVYYDGIIQCTVMFEVPTDTPVISEIVLWEWNHLFRDLASYVTPIIKGHPRNPGILSIPGFNEPSVVWDTKGHPRNSGILSIPGLKEPSVVWDTKGHPRNPGILSIPGLKESTVIWDTKRHPRSPRILSIPGLKESTVIWDTKRHPRSPGILSILRLKESTVYGTPRDIPGVLEYLIFRDSRNPLSMGHQETSQESRDT